MSQEGCEMAYQRLHLPTCFRTLWWLCGGLYGDGMGLFSDSGLIRFGSSDL